MGLWSPALGLVFVITTWQWADLDADSFATMLRNYGRFMLANSAVSSPYRGLFALIHANHKSSGRISMTNQVAGPAFDLLETFLRVLNEACRTGRLLAHRWRPGLRPRHRRLLHQLLRRRPARDLAHPLLQGHLSRSAAGQSPVGPAQRLQPHAVHRPRHLNTPATLRDRMDAGHGHRFASCVQPGCRRWRWTRRRCRRSTRRTRPRSRGCWASLPGWASWRSSRCGRSSVRPESTWPNWLRKR